MGYWDIFNEAHDKLIRIDRKDMSISYDGGATLEHVMTFKSCHQAGIFAQMLIDMLDCNKVKVN